MRNLLRIAEASPQNDHPFRIKIAEPVGPAGQFAVLCWRAEFAYFFVDRYWDDSPVGELSVEILSGNLSSAGFTNVVVGHCVLRFNLAARW